MKYFFIATILLTSPLWSVAPSRLIDGKPQYAISEVNGIICWTKEEEESLIDAFEQFKDTAPYTVFSYLHSSFEITLATGGLTYKNYDDFEKSLTDKEYLQSKLDDLPPSVARKNQASIDFLKSEAAKTGE